MSKPFQRLTKSSEPAGKIRLTAEVAAKKDDTFSLIVHDGVRFLKLVLLMANQSSIVQGLHERNKFLLKHGYIDTSTDKGTVIVLVDGMDQLAIVHNDKKTPKLHEMQSAIQGMTIKQTNAPKWTYLNDHAKESGEKVVQEQEDEFTDLYKQMDVHDLTGREIIFIKRFE